jgi:hypothetical protein
MKYLKPYITLLLFSAMLASCGSKPAESQQDKIENISTKKKTAPVNNSKKTLVYYFHTTARCYSCKTIEIYTKNVLHADFKNEINSKKIIFKSINVENPQNNHFIQDYQLYTKSVVLVNLENNKEKQWKTLNKTWNHLKNKTAFNNYIKSELINFIKENK